LAIDPQNPNTVYAAANGRLFKTTSGGTGWRPGYSARTSDGGPLFFPVYLAIEQ
jgi:hypothetical protein